jgi:hypothetical protein
MLVDIRLVFGEEVYELIAGHQPVNTGKLAFSSAFTKKAPFAEAFLAMRQASQMERRVCCFEKILFSKGVNFADQ